MSIVLETEGKDLKGLARSLRTCACAAPMMTLEIGSTMALQVARAVENHEAAMADANALRQMSEDLINSRAEYLEFAASVESKLRRLMQRLVIVCALSMMSGALMVLLFQQVFG